MVGNTYSRGDRRDEGSYHHAMSRLLLNLRNVPHDEADGVRAMLDAQGIAFYETRPSMWGISAGGIWVTEDTAYADARLAMDEFQRQRRDQPNFIARQKSREARAQRRGNSRFTPGP